MSIQVNTGANAVNWEALLGKIGEVSKTTGADGKDVFTVTTNVDGETRTATISLPELEMPEVMDEAAFSALVSKLEATGLGFTPEQVAEMKDAVMQAYNAAADSVNNVRAKSTGSVLFDLYALMALMVEVAQSQRDAARDMRTAQNQAIQKSIQDQADMQREAARVGMIVGIVCGAASAVVSLGMMAAQSYTANTQSKIMAQSGADASKMHSTTLQNMDTVDHANAQLSRTEAKVGEAVANRVTSDFETQLVDDQAGNLKTNLDNAVQGVDAAKTDVEVAEANVEAAKTTLGLKEGEKRTAQTEVDQKSAAVNEAQQAYDNAVANETAQNEAGKKLFGPDSKAGTKAVETAKAKLDTAKAELNAAQTKLERATADVASQNDVLANCNRELANANTKLGQAETKLTQAREDYVKTVQDVAAQYESKYQTAVDQLANPPEGMTKAELKANVETARAEMEMAYAAEAKLLAADNVLTPSQQKDIVAVARAKVDTAINRVYQSTDFKAAERRMSMFIGLNSINQSIGGVAQSVAQSLTAIKSADASRLGAETKEQEEMLDQTKDLFQQEQKLIDAVGQLLSAVIQAETQSMRDAIQA